MSFTYINFLPLFKMRRAKAFPSRALNTDEVLPSQRFFWFRTVSAALVWPDLGVTEV